MKNYILFILLFSSLTAKSQVPLYEGGDDDGYSSECYSQGQPPIVYGLFTGGENNGQSVSCFQQGISYGSYFPFFGGTDNNTMEAISCFLQPSSPNTISFYGGVMDGADVSCYLQSLPISTTTYFGGDDDGYALDCYVQDLGPPQYGMYTGGVNDGADVSCFLQQNSSVFVAFYGGSDNFDDVDCYLQTPPDTYINIYHGGPSTNQPIDCFAQLDYLIPLPVELVSFDAVCTENQVNLSWSTASELNSEYFLIEKSLDNILWEEVAEIEAAGNSLFSNFYTFVDNDPLRALSYYRLKQFDIDGKYEYSPIRSINCSNSSKKPEILTYPNPVNQKLNIQFSNFSAENCTIQLYNSGGQLMYSNRVELTNGEGVFELQRAHSMAPGFYFMVLKTKNNSFKQKLIFQ